MEMREHTKRAMVIGMALLFVAPALQVSLVSEAMAGPFDTLSGSRKGGKRTHKQKAKKETKQKRTKSSSSSSSNRGTTRTTTTRTTPTRRTTSAEGTSSRHTTTRRPATSSRGTTTTRRRVDDRRVVRCTSSGRCDGDPSPSRAAATTTTTSRQAPVRRTTTTRTTTTRHGQRSNGRVVRVHPRPTRRHHRSRSTTVVHHHHHGSRRTNTRYYGRSNGEVSEQREQRQMAPSRPEREIYLTGGVGLSGLAAPQVASGPLPGLDFSLGVGAKRRLLVGEVGLGLTGYRLDPQMAINTADMTLASVTGDVKLQPKLAFIEPYISAGLGAHMFNDHIIDESAAGASFRLGAGVDLRFDTVALSAQYQRNFMSLLGDAQIYEDGSLGATTETLGLGLKIYF